MDLIWQILDMNCKLDLIFKIPVSSMTIVFDYLSLIEMQVLNWVAMISKIIY